MSMHGRAVVNAITDAMVIASRHPALYVRVAQGSNDIRTLQWAYEGYVAGFSTSYWFVGDSPAWRRERAVRRAKGKRQRQARKANR